MSSSLPSTSRHVHRYAGFTFATFIALLYVTSSNALSELYAAEVWTIHSLCVGGIWSSLSISGSTIGNLIKMALLEAVNFYTIWMIFIGFDKMAHPPCSRAAFFFAKVDMYHWYRTYLKVQYTITCIVTGILFLVFLSIIFDMVNKRGIRKAATSTIFSDGEDRQLARRCFAIFFMYLLPVLIMAPEFLIRWNHIEGVGTVRSTGQLIPLIIAVTGLVNMLYKIVCNTEDGAKPEQVEGAKPE